ncbi:MAG TPA: HTTM domain-containing protein, partial [Isosphaeraceae bacterium]
MIARMLRPWNRFWFAPISARPLGAFRVVFGFLAVCNLLFMTVDFDYWLTSRGLLQGQESLQVAGPYRLSPLNWFPDPITVRIAFGLTLGFSVGLMLGWHTKVMSILVYLGMLSIHHHNLLTASGADTLLICIAFYLMLSRCGAAYSLDARRAARKRGYTLAEPLIVPWAQRLIQLQVACVYLVTGLLKANGGTWMDGTAMHYVLTNREIGRFDFSFLAAYPLAINALTYGGMAIEIALAFLLWVKAARPWVITAGLMLHAGILFIINIP